MSERRVLYEDRGCRHIRACDSVVNVEPVAELDVNYDSGPFYVKGLGELPYGKYAIVRLEATDE